MYKIVLLLVMFALPTMTVYGQQITDETIKRTTGEDTLSDALVAERLANEKKTQIQMEIDSLKIVEEEIPDLLRLAGKKIKSQRQLDVLNFIYNRTNFPSSARSKLGLGVTLLCVVLTCNNDIPEGEPISITIRKKLDKGKLSKEFIPYIEKFQSYIPSYVEILEEDLNIDWDKLTPSQ